MTTIIDEKYAALMRYFSDAPTGGAAMSDLERPWLQDLTGSDALQINDLWRELTGEDALPEAKHNYMLANLHPEYQPLGEHRSDVAMAFWSGLGQPLPDPVIEEQPEDLALEMPNGGAFTIVVSIEYGDLFYLWQAQDGGSWVNAESVLSDASGATTDTLTINSSDSAVDNFDIRCRVRGHTNDSTNQVMSDIVTLITSDPTP